MSEFNNNTPIYLQIVEQMCDKILSGVWSCGERVPSVRELGATIGVNPNTVMRTYERLVAMEVIENKRGIGYFVTLMAKERILMVRREHFLTVEVKNISKRMKQLGITVDELVSWLNSDK